MINVRKNSREVIRVRLREYKGHRFVDARIFFPGPDDELRPSGKGVTISIDLAGDLSDAVRKVAQQEAFDDDD